MWKEDHYGGRDNFKSSLKKVDYDEWKLAEISQDLLFIVE
jgi:hypothetical protein